MIKLALVLALLAPAMTVHAKKEKPMEWKGQYGGPIDAEQQVITDEAGWTRLWLTLGQDAPEFDFKKFFAVGVMAGEKPMGGYVIEFLDPVPKGMDVTIRYRVNAPTGFSTQAIAQPWKVRGFPRVKGKVFVEELKKVAPPKK